MRGQWVDPVATHQRQQHPGKPNPARGRVVRGAVARGDTIIVQIEDWSKDEAYAVGPKNWDNKVVFVGADPDGGNNFEEQLPQAGMSCLLTFDHLGDAWVAVWG